MIRSTPIFKRLLHDRKLPSIKGYTRKTPVIKSSFESPRKFDNNKTTKIIEKKNKNKNYGIKK